MGATRPLVLEYPNDPATWGDRVEYKFLAGKDFVVTPVYPDSDTRHGIDLAEGTWVDYWSAVAGVDADRADRPDRDVAHPRPPHLPGPDDS